MVAVSSSEGVSRFGMVTKDAWLTRQKLGASHVGTCVSHEYVPDIATSSLHF